MTAATNANGAVTRYTYCSCGSLESVTNAFDTPVQNVARYYYDNQGNLAQSVGPDSFTVNYSYNALGQLTNVADPVTSVTNYYNNQGLLAASFNAFGQISAAIYDPLDRATNTVDANGVTITNTFDDLNRLRTRGYPDQGVEKFVYTAGIRGVTSYTNQLGTNVVNYAYDALGRKTSEIYPKLSTNTFRYSAAGDLLALTNGNRQATTWNYDQFGRATNKLDATGLEIFRWTYDLNNRLTNRWSPAKGDTAYSYDHAGNLLNIDYSGDFPISFGYDALNRLTYMSDVLGETYFTHNDAGQLLSEDGPFVSDTITYSYANRLRTSLSLDQSGAAPWTNAYSHDAAKRLTSCYKPNCYRKKC